MRHDTIKSKFLGQKNFPMNYENRKSRNFSRIIFSTVSNKPYYEIVYGILVVKIEVFSGKTLSVSITSKSCDITRTYH